MALSRHPNPDPQGPLPDAHKELPGDGWPGKGHHGSTQRENANLGCDSSTHLEEDAVMPQVSAAELVIYLIGMLIEAIAHWFAWLIDDDRKRKGERE